MFSSLSSSNAQSESGHLPSDTSSSGNQAHQPYNYHPRNRRQVFSLSGSQPHHPVATPAAAAHHHDKIGKWTRDENVRIFKFALDEVETEKLKGIAAWHLFLGRNRQILRKSN